MTAATVCAEPGCWRPAVERSRCRYHQLPRSKPGRASPQQIARLRALLVARFGERCVVCGARDRLEVHHIDGDPSNNLVTNVELRCFAHNPRGGAHGRPRKS